MLGRAARTLARNGHHHLAAPLRSSGRPAAHQLRTCSSSRAMDASVQYNFGPYKIRGDEVFCISRLSFAFVNLKPVVPGHVLICSLRVAARFGDLAPEEVADMWSMAQLVGSKIEPHFGANSLTLAIQDAIDESSKSLPKADVQHQQQGEQLNLDAERRVRTIEEMVAEAAELRKLFH